MKIKILSFALVTLFLGSALLPSISSIPIDTNQNLNTNSILDGGYLEEIDGVKILHVSGSYYEMGYQHGYLLKQEIRQNYRSEPLSADFEEPSEEELMKVWNITKKYMPDEIMNEFHGMANSTNISFEKINLINMGPVLHHTDLPQQCSGFAAWGPATSNGELIQVASSDITLEYEDPITGVRPQENQVLIVREPENGYASMYPAYAGFYGWNGINSQGIGICIQASWTDKTTYKGIPLKYRVQLALDKASTAEEAIDIITSNKTIGYNVIVSDAKVPVSYVIEMNADTTYIGTYNNSYESQKPFWEIDHVIRRTNFYISSSLAETQRSHYSPKSLFLLLLGQNIFYPFWRVYLGMSRGLEKHWGNIDVNNSMEILMDAYNGKSDFVVSLVQRLRPINRFARKMGYLQALNQFSANPKTGDMLVTFADRENPSYENDIHRFNLFELMD